MTFHADAAKKTASARSGSALSIWVRAARCWQLYLFLLIPVVYVLIFCYYPMLGVQIAFKDFEPTRGIWGSEWVGLAHFKRFFASYQFGRVVSNTLKLSIYSLLASFPLTIILALVINSIPILRFKKLVQTITYIPHFISTVVIVGMIFQMLSPVTGLYGSLFKALGGEGMPVDILGKVDVFPHLYVWSGIWQGIGWGTIIYIAALAGTDVSLHEAAEIDGATRVQRMIHIDLPSILPTVSIMLILAVGGLMNVGFEKILLMQNGMNLRVSEVIATYVYKVGLAAGKSDYSYAAAIGLFNSIVNCALLVIANSISKLLQDDATSLW